MNHLHAMKLKMKPLTLLCSLGCLLLLSGVIAACDDTKTYAEMREDEDDAIAAFIKDSAIHVITQTEFFDNDSTTDVSKNEYVQLTSGVYMQIVDKGSSNPADTIRPNDIVLVRFEEQALKENSYGYKSYISNINYPDVDEFKYAVTSTSIAGTFTKGVMVEYYSDTTVPAGWLIPLSYVRDNAHVRLIVPSKMGHNYAMQNVYPYYYDLRKIKFWK